MVFETRNRPETRSTQRMLPRERLDRIEIAFDDHRLVANAGLILPVTLAHHLGLGELVDRHVDLGDAPGRANAGDKLLTRVASALADGTPLMTPTRCAPARPPLPPAVSSEPRPLRFANPPKPRIRPSTSSQAWRAASQLTASSGPLPNLLTAGRNPASHTFTPPESRCPAGRRTRP